MTRCLPAHAGFGVHEGHGGPARLTPSLGDGDARRMVFAYELAEAGGEARCLQGQVDLIGCVDGCATGPGGQVPLPSTLGLLPLAAAAAGLARRCRIACGAPAAVR